MRMATPVRISLLTVTLIIILVVGMIISSACYIQGVVIVDSVGRKTKAVGEAKGKT